MHKGRPISCSQMAVRSRLLRRRGDLLEITNELIARVRKVFALHDGDGVTLKLKKCCFFTKTIDWLKLIIRPGALNRVT